MNSISIAIERDIPLPTVSFTYPYPDMKIGDSFYIEDVSLQVICNNNYRAGKRLSRKFIARSEGDGVRVWRLT